MDKFEGIKIITKEEFKRIGRDYKGMWEASPFNMDRVACGELHPYFIGRRNMLSYDRKSGTTLITEGLHFLIDGDYGNLPILNKENARPGAFYQFADGCLRLYEVYRITPEYAREHDLYCLDRVRTSLGDFALPGGDRI